MRGAVPWAEDVVLPGDADWWTQLRADLDALLPDGSNESALAAVLASPGVLRRLAVAVGDRLPADTEAVTSEAALAPLATAVSLRTGLPVVVDATPGQPVATIVQHGRVERDVGLWDVVPLHAAGAPR